MDVGTDPGIAVALGSNLGSREEALGRALEAMDAELGLEAISGVYATPPRGPGVSAEFWNLCAVLRGAPEARELLEYLHGLEAREGRPRRGGGRRGDRRLDLDLLVYGDRRIEEPDLVVPHPRMLERAFVMVPLRDVGPEWVVPGAGETVESVAGRLDAGGIRRVCSGEELVERRRGAVGSVARGDGEGEA